MKIFQGMNIPKVVQKLVFGCVGYATNFPSSSGQFARCIALHLEIRREPSSWLASRQSLPRLNLEPCARTMVARSRQKICAAALPNSQFLIHFRYICKIINILPLFRKGVVETVLLHTPKVIQKNLLKLY